MEKLIVASNNKNKIREIREILLNHNIEVLSLEDINLDIDVEETGTTFKENAYIKAKTIYDMVKIPVIGDDSGLEVEALNNEPGIFSARYAGLQKCDSDNVDKLIENMKGIENTKARFVCSMALVISDDEEYIVEDYLYGDIILERRGQSGFGYDPIFYLKELEMTNAQLTPEYKNSISHRAKALKQIEKIVRER